MYVTPSPNYCAGRRGSAVILILIVAILRSASICNCSANRAKRAQTWPT